ncbi:MULTISPECIES: DUF4297 family anti-phage-associated protein [Roseobacteraceae]|mgnify:CR=1 FL=1|jgi:hypothetical protein|uniref:DUF4297 family anti-phage-associated protein n=1 Tax=Roseobacteraceae TaxID=2854170 RepID=UPI000B7A80AE|nr:MULTISPECIES: DUF4297 family anti-phage-associated protein [Roseobacteraceae]MBW4963699.1 hypothetical protein [Sulfitobacter sp. CW3]|tara:strand:+ start:477 stop:1697 length:1221 start_codon:yes stop_codon:yes gene_type:complete
MLLTDRSAVPTIRGYFYQFDRSILSILELAEATESVAIECIEDIDVRTATDFTAVQCKYYEKTEYNHSVIKPAIIFMLSHYKDGLTAGRPSIKYKLSGYFESGQSKLVMPFNIDFLKENFLTVTSKKITEKKHEELNVSDQELKGFLEALSIDVDAAKFDDQFNTIIGALAKRFDCSLFTAEFFYYNSALRVIKELSTQTDEALRIITRQEFLERIDTSSILFDEWFVAKRGKAKYYQKLRNEFFVNGLNISSADRLFIIHVSESSYQRGAVKGLLKTISRKYSKLSPREAKPFSPYVLLCGIDDAEIAALKQELHNESLRFLDGYDFKDAEFDGASISRSATHSNGPDLRIFSYLFEAQQTFQSFLRSREIYEFYEITPVADFGDDAIKHVRLQVPDYKDIESII